MFSPSGAALQCIGSTQSNTSDSDAHTRFRGKKQTTNPHKQPEPELTGVKEIRRHELLFQEACDASTPYPTAQPMSANRARCKASPKPPQKAVCAAESDTDSPTCTQPHEKYTGQGSYLVWQVSIHSTWFSVSPTTPTSRIISKYLSICRNFREFWFEKLPNCSVGRFNQCLNHRKSSILA